MVPLTVAGLTSAYRTGQLTPSQVATECLSRAAGQGAQGVFITLTQARAMREAAASTARWQAGRPLSPLDGVPVTWKDLIDIEGTPTTGGSRTTSTSPAVRDAEAVALLSAAGAICIGKTNLSEFAYSGLGMNPWYGTPRNPHGPDGAYHVCGGSSSGAAASVAMSLCAVAIGTDTSGSVRVPAAFTGLCGWKPHRHAFPLDAVMPLAPSLDTLGVIARTVGDAMQVHLVLAGPNAGSPPAPLRRIVADTRLFSTCDEAPRVAAIRALASMEASGTEVEFRTVPEFDAVDGMFARYGTLVAAEAFRRYQAVLDSPEADLIDPLVRSRLEAASGSTPGAYEHLLEARDRLSADLLRHWPDTAFACPTTPITAPTFAQALQPHTYGVLNARALTYTMIGSFLDLPSMALPTGFDDVGLPTSLLLSSHAGNDLRLLYTCSRSEIGVSAAASSYVNPICANR